MSAAGSLDVLYVEDDDAWARLVRDWLTDLGLSVHRVRTSAQFQAYLDACEELPRCVVMDLHLGGEHGFDVCDAAKRSARLQALPIIVLTATRATSRDAFEHRALHCVQKGPDTQEELCAAVKAVLEQLERSQGVIDAGGLRLDPRDGSVLWRGQPSTKLPPGLFAAMRLLVLSAPLPVAERELYDALLSRRSYRTEDPEGAARSTVRNYISELRRKLGPELGERIRRCGEGYALLP